jgi:DNA-binding IclR family transcriptional regulator
VLIAGHFYLSPELRRLGALSQKTFDLKAFVRAALCNLNAATQETSSFYVCGGRQCLCHPACAQ